MLFFNAGKQPPSGCARSKQNVCIYVNVDSELSVCVCVVCAVCRRVLMRCGLIKSVLEKEEQTGVIEEHKGTQSD